jgi:hypothetical protein
MTDHDGIKTLMDIPDPVERGLALKSKRVEPYHLRHALQDMDPHIRSIAAAHPNLTPELMSEVLAGDDKDLKHIVLARPDLQDHHLAQVATDPEHALEVARHPRTTDEIRELALQHHAVPEGVKALHSASLSKNIGHITYPLLGEGKVYTKPMNRKTAGEVGHGVKSNAVGAMFNNARDSAATEPGERTMSGWVRTVRQKGSPETQTKLMDKESNPYRRFGLASQIDTGKAIKAVEDHEAQHSVFGRLSQKYGDNATRRIIATTLSKLPEQHRNHIKSLYSATGSVHDDSTAPEETIAYLHNYLQDPNRRAAIHAKLKLVTKDSQQKSVNLARQAWNHLRKIGMSMRPEDVGVNPQDERDRMSKWVKQLAKRESIPSDQLGFSVSFFEIIAICEFLTQRTVDQQTLRQAVRNADGDGLTGVLTAFSLNTPEGRKAFDSVKALKLHKAEDVLKTPKAVVGIDNDEIAKDIVEAYKNNGVTSVALGGKHSSGAYIAKDKDGANWLLKPGSGKKSPAAGVDETSGSQSRREAIFAAVAQKWDIAEVQPAHLLSVDGREVAAIKMWPMDWVNLHRTLAEDATLPRRALEPYRRNGHLFKWSVIDFVLGNPDRHGNNLMVGPEIEGNKIGLIDHGSALAGPSFDPGHDKDSFVPYYLRVWAGPGFHGMDPKEQLTQMPELAGEADEDFRQWVTELDPKEMEAIIHRLGMDPAPSLARLQEIQSDPMATKMSRHVNQCWLESSSSVPG